MTDHAVKKSIRVHFSEAMLDYEHNQHWSQPDTLSPKIHSLPTTPYAVEDGVNWDDASHITSLVKCNFGSDIQTPVQPLLGPVQKLA